MAPYQGYQLWQAERPKTVQEQHAADARQGEFAAAMSRSRKRVGCQLCAAAGLRPRRWRSVRPSGHSTAAASLRAAG
jgi:hypothetical protein